jgi:hypothetical protein
VVPLIVLSLVPAVLTAIAFYSYRLFFGPRVPTALEAAAAISVATWIVVVILRWAHLGGHFEQFSLRRN